MNLDSIDLGGVAFLSKMFGEPLTQLLSSSCRTILDFFGVSIHDNFLASLVRDFIRTLFSLLTWL
jgi:hypothetical protein